METKQKRHPVRLRELFYSILDPQTGWSAEYLTRRRFLRASLLTSTGCNYDAIGLALFR